MGNSLSLNDLVRKKDYNGIEKYLNSMNKIENFYGMLKWENGYNKRYITITNTEDFLLYAIQNNEIKLVTLLLKYAKLENEHITEAIEKRNYEIISLLCEKRKWYVELNAEMLKDRQLINIMLSNNVDSVLGASIKHNKVLAMEIINDGYIFNNKEAFKQAIICNNLDIASLLDYDEECYELAIKYGSKNVIHLFKPNVELLNKYMMEACKTPISLDMIEFLIEAGCKYKYIGIELSRYAYLDEVYMFIKKLIKADKIDIKTINDVDETMKTIAYKRNDLRLMTLLSSVINVEVI